MSLSVAVTFELHQASAMAAEPLLRISNQETLQIPAPLVPASADLIVAAFERLGDDVQERAVEQARQMMHQRP